MSNLSQKEKEVIVAALHAAAPTGGGSTQFHLANKLANEWDIEVDYKQVGYFQKIAHGELQEWLDDQARDQA